MPATALPFRSLLLGICLLFAPHSRAESTPLPADAPPVVPLRGLAYTREDIVEVRRQAREHGANSEVVAGVLKLAEEWVARPLAEVDALVPPPGAVFAYGSAGDPKTNQAWPRFGRQDNMCSFDRPGTVRSPHTGDIYGTAKPGEPYHDDGKGWTRQEDGQVFYFKGVWHSWVTERLHEAVDNLAVAYMLTGRADYAERALHILDRLGTLRIQLPTTGNSVADWPHSGGAPEPKGFFQYMGNIANQRAINTAYAYDLIANAPAGAEPSAGAAGLSVRENIEKNYFEIYERRYLAPEMRSLTNHGIILVANLVTQGVLLGRADYLQEGLHGTQGFFDNTINRDGDYMEVSGSYGRLGRDYGSRLVGPLVNYSPANYPASAAMPALPGGLRPGDDLRWYDTAVRMLYRLPVLGRYPQYGDMGMDRAILLDEDNVWLAKHRSLFLRILHRQTTREDWKREIETLYARAAAQKQSPLQLEEILTYGISLWVEPPAPPSGHVVSVPGERSDLMGGKGIAILRSGEKASSRALFLRAGINTWHGHDDQMTLVPYGHGMSLFGEFGYRWSGTPDNLGWGTRSIAHNAVVVDEDLPAPYLYKGFAERIPAPAASVTAFLADAESPAQLVEMRNPALYTRARLADYRRAAWLVDIDAKRYYFVDVFQVVGGNTHDYAWNSQFIDPPLRPGFRVEGIAPEKRPGVWTLASVGNEKVRGEAWNQPGQSWGERLNGENGVVNPLPGEKKLPVTKWNPDPGNGYGMIWDVKLQDTRQDWNAVWPLPDRKHSMRARLLNLDGMTAITALSPSMTPSDPFNLIVARRTRAAHAEAGAPLHSRFVNVVEVGRDDSWPLVGAVRVPVRAPSAGDVVALKVDTAANQTDHFLASRSVQAIDAGAVRLIGRNAFVRLDAEQRLVALSLQEGTRIDAGGWKIEAATAAFQASVRAVHPGREHSRLVIDGALPAGSVLAGSTMLLDGTVDGDYGYPHNDYYSIEEIEPAKNGGSVLVFRKQSLVFASLNLEAVNNEDSTARLYWNHTLAGKAGNLSYRGRGVVASGGAADESSPVLALVRRIDARDLALSRVDRLSAGQRVDVLVAKPGDLVSIPTSVTFTAVPGRDGVWRIRTTTPLRVTPPKAAAPVAVPAGESLLDANGSLLPSPRA